MPHFRYCFFLMLPDRIRHLLDPLTPAEAAALLRELSDLESGGPRQWLLLEIAATLPPPLTTRRVSMLTFLARWLGIASLEPSLRYLALPGIAVYQTASDEIGRAYRRGLDDAALWIVTLDALLAGSQRLPASHQFVAWLLLLIGGTTKLWRFRQRHPKVSTDVDGEESLPGAEAALGLNGLLLARGATPQQAQAHLAELNVAPDAALPALTRSLPELLPTASREELRRALLAGWVLPLLPALWLGGWPWSWLGTLFWTMALAWFAHRKPAFPALLLACATVGFALVRIVHLV